MADIVIIGLGHLGRYVLPGVERLAGPEVSRHVWAVTKHRDTAQRLQREFGFPVSADDSLEVLGRVHPDIILVAVQPTVIDSVIQNVLVPYFAALRKENRRLPEIYTFGPSPDPAVYSQALGKDVYAVKILPSMLKKLRGIGFVTWNQPFPQERRERALLFSSTFNRVVELPHKESLYGLASKIALYLLTYGALDVADSLSTAARPVGHGTVLGEVLRRIGGEGLPARLPPEAGIPPAIKILTARIVEAWLQGIHDANRQAGIPEDVSRRYLGTSGQAELEEALLSTRKELQDRFTLTATKGGLAEQAATFYQQRLKEPLLGAVGNAAAGRQVPETFSQQVETWGKAATEEIAAHAFLLDQK